MESPPEKMAIPAPGAEKAAPQEATIKSFGQMRVIEEKVEPILSVPPPAPAPAQ
jgi:hypothetical protein